MDINKELPEALGYVIQEGQPGLYYRESDDDCMLVERFDYRYPAIFAECMNALPDGVVIFKGPLWEIYSDWLDFRNAIVLVEDEDLFKAIALAVIQAKEG